MMKLENVDKYYNINTSSEVHALKNINLSIEKGEMVATVYNDKEGQADGMLNLAFALATDEGLDEVGLENDRYIRLPYQKVTRENVCDFQK